MITINMPDLTIQVPPDLVQYWGWFLVLSIGLVVLGAAAVTHAASATIVSTTIIGALLIAAFAIEFTAAALVGHWIGFFQHLLAAIVFGVIGFLLLMRPLLGAEVVTMLMIALFMISGLFETIVALWLKLPGWLGHLADGIATLIIGLLVLWQWPASGMWAVGLFVGIDLILYGIVWFAFALSLRTSA